MSSPEPMALSPTASPAMTGQFLPQYLLGESSVNSSQINSKNSPKFWVSGNSPPRATSLGRSYSIYDNNAKYSDKAETSFNSHFSSSHQNIHGYHGHHHHHHHHHHGHGHSQSIDRLQDTAKPGAPPVNRLIDTFNKSASINVTPTVQFNDSRRYNEPFDKTSLQDASFTQMNQLSPPSPTQIDRFYTHGESIKADDTLDETWVTVFGFPPSATTFILQEFSIHGQIIKYVPSTQGNWMHIQYQTKLHAQKALSKNGKILANAIMIGVLPCIDKVIMQQHTGTENLMKSASTISTDLSTKGTSSEYLGPPHSKLIRTQSLRGSIRPLGASNHADKEDDFKLPRKNTNIIGKAMEYMFGW